MNITIAIMMIIGTVLILGALAYFVLSIAAAFPGAFISLFLGLFIYSLATVFLGTP